MDYFQKQGAGGPTMEANIRAKWLSHYCPQDLKIAFAPYSGQVPLYKREKIQLINQDEPGWWNHYFFNSSLIDQQRNSNWSLGPNIDLSKPAPENPLLVVYSNYQKEVVLKNWNVKEENIFVIPNMIDNELFSPGAKNNQITVGWIGYDHPSRYTKGVEVIPYLARKHPGIQFEMIHARKPKYQHEWMSDPLPNVHVLYEVKHDKMPEIIKRWHVLVCGSKWETFGSQVLEAMACGVPVISAAVGAIPEVASSQMLLTDVKRGQPPQVKYPHDWTQKSLERFSEALQRVLNDPKLYQSLVKQGLHESEKFHPKVVSNKWFEFMYQCRHRLNE